MSLATLGGVLQSVGPGNIAGSSVDLSTMMLEISKHKSDKSETESGA